MRHSSGIWIAARAARHGTSFAVAAKCQRTSSAGRSRTRMRSRFIFAVATLVLVGCRDGALTGRRTVEAERQTAATDSSPTTRRLWSGRQVDALGSPSPDGKYLSFVDWDTGDLALRELATGHTRAIVKTRGDVSEFAYYSAFS